MLFPTVWCGPNILLRCTSPFSPFGGSTMRTAAFALFATAAIAICTQATVLAQGPTDFPDRYRLAQGGTNTQAGSMYRGVHVYCPGNSPSSTANLLLRMRRPTQSHQKPIRNTALFWPRLQFLTTPIETKCVPVAGMFEGGQNSSRLASYRRIHT